MLKSRLSLIASFVVLSACSMGTNKPVVSVDPRAGEVSAVVDGTELKGALHDGVASLRSADGDGPVAEHLCLDGDCKDWVMNVYRNGPAGVLKEQAVSASMEMPAPTDPDVSSQEYVGLPLSKDGARALGAEVEDETTIADRENELGPWLDLTGGGQAFGPAQTVNKKNADGTTTAIYGHLENDSQIPVTGPSFKSFDRTDSFLAGHMLSLLQNAAVEYATTISPGATVAIGGISKRGGGLNPGHSSHQNGMDADIPYMGHKTYVNMLDKAGNVTDKFDPEKNWAFFRLLYDQKILDGGKPKSVISMILVGPKLKDFLCRWATEKGVLNDPVNVELMKRVRPTVSHDDHMHVRLHCSPHHAGCLKQNYAPKTTGCEAPAAATMPIAVR